MARLVVDAGGAQPLDLALNEGQRYCAVVPDPEVKAVLLRMLADAAPIAVVAGGGGFVANLKVWENLALPASYFGKASLAELEAHAERLFREFGIARERFAELCALLPDRLSTFERRLAAFVRAMLVEPEIMIYDGLFEGLARAEADTAARFDLAFRLRFPFRTALFIEAQDPSAAALNGCATFRL